MIGILVVIITVITASLGSGKSVPVVVIPPMPECSPVISADESEWNEFHADAVAEYADEFTRLFNSYEIKRAKNGRMMIRSGNSGPYKFARKGN